MALRNILIEGAPGLRKKARPVTKFDDKLKSLVNDMYETMEHENGIGLAATQVAMMRRLFVMKLDDDPEVSPEVFINPELLEQEGEQEYLEGCLSLPDLYGFVKRPARIKVKYQDLEGNEHIEEADGLRAVCMCHEMDHLDGVLFRDRAYTDLKPIEAWTEGRKKPETVEELNEALEDERE